MELFKNIRLKIGNAILTKKMAGTKRIVYYSSFSMVKTIGIVWDASRPEDFGSLSKFCQKMHVRNIDVKIISYFPGKNLPDQYTAITYLTCIRKKEINFFYHPVSSETNIFISNRFDILIDINFRKLLPLKYISSLSNAAFKVGLFESEAGETPFDLMMEIKKPVDVENYLIQVIEYLEMINSGTVKTVNNN
jgi:hypothetical protein